MKKAYPMLLATLFSISSMLQAEETQDHIEFNSRPLSEKDKRLMEQKRSLEENDETGAYIQPSLFRPSSQKTQCQLVDYFAPIASHWIAGFVDSRTIQLEDGSEWIVHSQDARKILSWRSQDWVSISPNTGIFASSPYYLKNETARSEVHVSPFIGPLAFGTYTFWVTGLDLAEGYVYVINGLSERSIWKVSSSDLYLFDHWNINDTLIVGVNTSWTDRVYGYDHVLINVPMNHYVRVKQL